MAERVAKAKSAETLASTFGAGILGFGIGALLAGFARRYAPWIILFGAALHGWGMYRMHTGKENIFGKILYWLCWVLLSGLIIYIATGFV